MFNTATTNARDRWESLQVSQPLSVGIRDTSQVYIRRDEQGNVILSKQPFETDSWQPLLAMLQNVVVPGNFLAAEDRLQGMIERDPFKNRF
ncbi:antitoxin [Serratia fonticola]